MNSKLMGVDAKRNRKNELEGIRRENAKNSVTDTEEAEIPTPEPTPELTPEPEPMSPTPEEIQ
jgi:hypothetical protein